MKPRAGWTGEISNEHESRVPVIDLTRDLRPAFRALAAEYGVPTALHPHIALAAAAKLVRMGRQAIDAGTGRTVILRALVAGSKTVPYPIV